MLSRNKITLISSSQEISGSIERIQAIGPYNNSSKVQRIEYGRDQGQLGSTITSMVSHSIEIPNGHTIMGPIGRLKGETGDWLVFLD
jgi:hypothetical protein